MIIYFKRHLFLPFIPFLQKECIIHNMDSYHDYRQEFVIIHINISYK